MWPGKGLKTHKSPYSQARARVGLNAFKRPRDLERNLGNQLPPRARSTPRQLMSRDSHMLLLSRSRWSGRLNFICPPSRGYALCRLQASQFSHTFNAVGVL